MAPEEEPQEKPATLEEEGNVPADGRKRAKVKRHCGRFWWIYAIVFVIVVLVVVLPVYVSESELLCTPRRPNRTTGCTSLIRTWLSLRSTSRH